MPRPFSLKGESTEGEVAEWFKAHAWKACILLKVSWVRIPLSPPSQRNLLNLLQKIPSICQINSYLINLSGVINYGVGDNYRHNRNSILF